MFLGYSETDENLLKTHNNQTVLDAVDSLDHFIRDKSGYNQVNKFIYLIIYELLQDSLILIFSLALIFRLYAPFFFII